MYDLRLRRLLLADALFELLLGIPLATATLTGLAGALDLPGPASDTAVAVFGIALLVAAAVIAWIAIRPLRPLVWLVAAANSAGAVLAGIWLALADGWTTAGALLVGGTALALLALAAGEAVLLRRGAGVSLRTPSTASP